MATQQEITGPLELVTAPLGRVVTLQEAKQQCRVDQDITIDDAEITRLIDLAQEFTEQLVSGHRQWLPAVYDLPLYDWPWCEPLRLPRPPLLAVLSVSYYDGNDASQTLATTVYRTRTPWKQPGTVELIYGQTWPALSSYRSHPVTVRFLAGYGRSFTADATSNVVTLSGAALPNNGKCVRLVSTTTLPAGLDAYTDYFVVNASANTFKLALTAGGSAIDITDAGTGTHFVAMPPETVRQAVLLLVAHGYANHLPVLVGSISKEVEFGVMSLLQNGAEYGSYA